MPSLFHTLETMAARGAEGLAPDARKALFDALIRLRHTDGGCAAPSGTPDPYYSLFAWLCLRALDPSALETAPVERYLLTCIPASPVDALCTRLVRLNAAPSPTLAKLRAVFSVMLHPPRDAYASFLSALTLDTAFISGMPKVLKRLIVSRLRVAGHAPTPRLAAKLTLLPPGHPECGALQNALLQRRCPAGGFVSSANASSPDLLATAVARFALTMHTPTGLTAADTAADLAFTETCWAGDGLFGPLPYPARGDTEHTFYALLALGTCRPIHRTRNLPLDKRGVEM